MYWLGKAKTGLERPPSKARHGLWKEHVRAEVWARRARRLETQAVNGEKESWWGPPTLWPALEGLRPSAWAPGLMGADLLGLPTLCLAGQKCLLETQHLLTCHRIKEEREIWHFPNPRKWKKKGFFTFRAISWMTEVIFCNWSVWAQASNCFLNYLLSISHLAACQNMLMSPEFLAWSFEEQISCFVFGNVGLGVQVLWARLAETLSSPLPLAVLRAMPRHSAQLPAVPERMPRDLVHGRADAQEEPGSVSSFSWVLDSTPVGDLASSECPGNPSEKKVFWSWCHLLREQGNSSNNLLFGEKRVRRVWEFNRPVLLLSKGRAWPSPRRVEYPQHQLLPWP